MLFLSYTVKVINGKNHIENRIFILNLSISILSEPTLKLVMIL